MRVGAGIGCLPNAGIALYRAYAWFTAAFVHRLTLGNYRDAARNIWPDLPRVDLHAMTLLLFALRFHTIAVTRAWSHAALLRSWSGRRKIGSPPRRIMHVTSSFDLGGTQRQIMQLCLSTTARFEHSTTEIFPEINFLYRQASFWKPTATSLVAPCNAPWAVHAESRYTVPATRAGL